MRKPKPYTDSWVFEANDKKFLTEQVSIVMKDYEDNNNRYHGGPLENLCGIIAESAFEGFLIDRIGLTPEIDFEWHKRIFNHQNDKRPWDFRICNQINIEIGAARPYHSYAILKKADYKTQSMYFCQIQIDYLRCLANVYYKGQYRWFLFDASVRPPKDLLEITNPIELAELQKNEKNEFARATIKGFDEMRVITNELRGWRLGVKPNPPTVDADGWHKLLTKIQPLSDLKYIIQSVTGWN